MYIGYLNVIRNSWRGDNKGTYKIVLLILLVMYTYKIRYNAHIHIS